MKKICKQFMKIFSIAGVNFCINSNFDISDLLFQPEPYNLHINYLIKKKTKSKKCFKINLLKSAKKLNVTYSDSELFIFGDVDVMFSRGYNKQFGLFGNKGLIHKFILHILELEFGINIFHAAAIKHPLKNRVCIAVGASGSGKSVFAMCALKIGWELIGTEQIPIGVNKSIFGGRSNFKKMF